jgi:hypothetical protein
MSPPRRPKGEGRSAQRGACLMSSATATLIRNSRIVTAVDDGVADVLIEGDRIQAVGQA